MGLDRRESVAVVRLMLDRAPQIEAVDHRRALLAWLGRAAYRQDLLAPLWPEVTAAAETHARAWECSPRSGIDRAPPERRWVD